jgi:beta-phosphoglucomutase-like phosphatase (HAD superfamily)
MIKAIIFDLDGVLVNADSWHYQAMKKALKEMADFQITRDEYDKVFDTSSVEEGLENLRERGFFNEILNVMDTIEPDEFLQNVSERRYQHLLETFQANVSESRTKCALFGTLVADGIKLACVTGFTKETALSVLGGTTLQRYLSIIITREDVVLPRPHPNGYWNAMSLLGVLPEETLIVEGSTGNAHVSGASVWGVTGPEEVTWRNLAHQMSLEEGT